ncbi:CLUMA_CG018739, isoform B [Clunio marinus]|uniref:Elongation of very long chain fatty acids protein n=1 Tax=Clunio marinus TaxID=568069 RepID=A0A1J1IZS6_9DIPT|nr:CLUMA_CG018739, isoform B [Clunio marinus]
MALVLKNLYSFYSYYFHEYEDNRVKGLFLLQSPLPITAILAVYLYFVNGKGQMWMKDRKAFKLNTILYAYNATQVLLNLYMGLRFISYITKFENLFCIPPPWNDFSKTALELRDMSHYYYLVKVLDLLDTVFFILRKKNNQVTFLHIYHHVIMAIGCYWYIKFFSGGGHAYSLGLINSFVHAIMYGYYLLTSLKPEIKESIWWKKYITQLQMVQFTILIIHFGVPIFTNCSFPKGLLIGVVIQNLFMLFLFGDFYYKAYVKKKT